jgi:hypothetical protein
MRRRRLLLGSLAVLGGAGCAGRPPATGTATTTEGPPTLDTTALRVTDRGCGEQVDAATVEFDADAPAVAVTGTVWGADLCHTARLADATYAPAADRLDVRVVAVRQETEGATCAQCIAEIEYAATCSFAGGLPGTVRVVHGRGADERVVATAER